MTRRRKRKSAISVPEGKRVSGKRESKPHKRASVFARYSRNPFNVTLGPFYTKGGRAFLRVLPTKGRGVRLCCDFSKPKGHPGNINAWLNNLYPVSAKILKPAARFVQKLLADLNLRMGFSKLQPYLCYLVVKHRVFVFLSLKTNWHFCRIVPQWGGGLAPIYQKWPRCLYLLRKQQSCHFPRNLTPLRTKIVDLPFPDVFFK